MLLQDKVLLITGSATGIGEATARRAVAEGARVMVHGLDAELARAVARDLGDPAAYLVADLAQPESAERLVAATVAHFGRIDGLMNNAASVARSTLENTTVDFFDRMIAINLRAPMLLIKAAVPHFRQQGRGVVLNIGSVNALAGAPQLLDYSISKCGLMTMTRNLANALSSGMIVFCASLLRSKVSKPLIAFLQTAIVAPARRWAAISRNSAIANSSRRMPYFAGKRLSIAPWVPRTPLGRPVLPEV